MDDPTAIEIDDHANSPDPYVRRMSGIAYHGHTPFDVPFISHIAGNLYTGGCEGGLVLPPNIKHLISLYPWERYLTRHELDSRLEVKQYDAADEYDLWRIKATVEWAKHCVDSAPTLIHCQAGLNRSGLIAGITLIETGHVPDEMAAIELLREKRSPAVLCNPTFAGIVRAWTEL